MENLVIVGSARGESNTIEAVRALSPVSPYELVDLRAVRIEPYDYDHEANAGDDFLMVVQKIQAAQQIVFATPVYWYAMSGRMKTFFDRLSELLSTHKQIGKSLKGKTVYLVAVGSDPQLPPGFETPFKLTSEYFGMTYHGASYLQMK